MSDGSSWGGGAAARYTKTLASAHAAGARPVPDNANAKPPIASGGTRPGG
ncbi:hypothetical protein OQ969_19995 [Mycobacterium ulcerans]|nr:hypothetical protein [Mycobacterium ulcerans]